jgi:hypothetical protein
MFVKAWIMCFGNWTLTIKNEKYKKGCLNFNINNKKGDFYE